MGATRPVIDSTRLRRIAELAEAVAEQHCGSGRICPVTVIERKRIAISYGNYADCFDGMIEHRGGRFHIYCNTNRSRHPARVRFTLSHELGHYFIDEHRSALEAGLAPHPSFADVPSDNPAEREADHFASHFLLPRPRFLKAASRLRPGLPAMLSIAEQFEISLTSTAMSFIDADVVPMAVIKWNSDGTFWKRFSTSTYQAGYRAIVTGRDCVPADSATGRAFLGEDLKDSLFYEGTTVASQWFPQIGQGTSKDLMVHEHSISLREFGFMTVIFPATKSLKWNDV